MTEYDKIAKEYSDTQDKRLTRLYIYDPSLFNQIGDVCGKSILDLGCGDGRLTRELKKRGASEVHGIDLSPEMIRIAKQKEQEKPLGIKYSIGKVGELGKIKEYDIVVGGLILHYSKSKEELDKMCKDIFLNLKSDGRFIALNNNPKSPLTTHKKYGSTVETEGKLEEGKQLTITLWVGQKICSFHNYHWKKETYEKSLQKAGLTNIKWVPVSISEEGIKKYGKEFWNEFFLEPYIILIQAEKVTK